MNFMDEKIFSAKDLYDALAYKVKLCKRELNKKNSCSFGDNCHFAHTLDELQFNKSLSDKVDRYIYDKIAENRVDHIEEEKSLSENKDKEIKYLKKLKKDLDDVKYINEKILKSNKELIKMFSDLQNDRYYDSKDINESLKKLQKNSDEIKETFSNYDSRNDSRIIIKRFRERSESPKEYFKRRRSISKESLNDDLDEFNRNKSSRIN